MHVQKHICFIFIFAAFIFAGENPSVELSDFTITLATDSLTPDINNSQVAVDSSLLVQLKEITFIWVHPIAQEYSLRSGPGIFRRGERLSGSVYVAYHVDQRGKVTNTTVFDTLKGNWKFEKKNY